MGSSINYGKRLLPQIIDDLASAEPDRVIFSVAKSADISQGFRHVSARVFASAVDKTAWLLYSQLGESLSSGPTIPTVAYIGPHDLRHILLTYACVKAGYTALFLSPKNSTEAALAVLEAANCKAWAKPAGKASALVESLLHKRAGMEVIDLPELDELLRDDNTRSFPYTKTFAEAAQDPLCILHTSGSTGLPKPISWTHALIGTMDAVRLLPPTKGDHNLRPWTDNWNDGDRIYSSFPMSHGAGIIMNILLPALFRLHCIMGPPGVIPNMNLIDSMAEHGEINIWSMIPSLVDEIGENPDILAKFAPSKFICASGGPVSPLMGGKVNQVIRVLNLTGTTEGLFIGNLWTEREDWFYFAFHPYSGFEFKEVEKGLYEHWVHRLDVNEQVDLFQGIFHTFPSEQSINLKDLYQQHPTKPYLWSYKGRNDDIIVLSNGYKISPLDTEAFITTHPAIEGCLMIGSGKPQAGLLIELKDATSAGKSDELLNSIWATVEKANSMSLHKNQISKDYIAFAQANKPFIRTDKRTVKRRATLELYNDYIDRFYESRTEEEDAAYQNSLPSVDTSSLESLSGVIQEILVSILPTPANNGTITILPEDDLFALGMDSILAFRAVKAIRIATGLHDKLTPRHMYGNPTLSKFTAIVWKLVQERISATSTSGHAEDLDPQVTKMKRLLAQHRARLSDKVNPFDLMNPNIYVGMKFYLSLSDPNDSDPDTFGQVYTLLREGLQRTMQMIPELQGRVMRCSEHEMGFKRGDLRITLPPVYSTATSTSTQKSEDVPQLKYKDLSAILPSFSELRAGGFAVSAFDDAVVLDCEWFPTLPADVLVAQANFIKGGCILAINVHHAGFDGVGVINAMRCWAENCRYIQGDRAATCSWVDPDSLNRNLLHTLYELEGYAKPAEEVDRNVWGYLGFPDPALLGDDDHVGEKNGSHKNGNGHATGNSNHHLIPTKTPRKPNPATLKSTLPTPPPFPRKFAWPPIPRPDGRSMRSTTFLISASNIEKLRLKVLTESGGVTTVASTSDLIQSLFWRCAIRARYRVEKELRSASISPDQISIVEMPIDARTYFSNLLPSSYMGSCLVTNRPFLPVEELVAPETKLSKIASVFKEAAKHISPELVHDAFTLLQSVPDYTMLTNACMGLAGFHCMMNNMMLFRTDEISFGFSGSESGHGAGKRGLLGRNGVPETMRVQMDRFNTAFRLLVILPMRADGGVELLLGTLPEEFAMLMRDGEFGEFASFLG